MSTLRLPPAEFEGIITVEWRANGPATPNVMPGWHFTIRTADGNPIYSVSEMTLHASADGDVWAELDMFADPNGKPVYDEPQGSGQVTQIHLDADKNILTGVFPFLVASMSVVP